MDVPPLATRLKEFFSRYGILVSTFADSCNIPRPSLSQLLNGRNKKVSNEVLEKIHAAYPEINMTWLIFGEGDMLVPNANLQPSGADAQPSQNTDFNQDQRNDSNAAQGQILFADDNEDSMPYRRTPPRGLNAADEVAQRLAQVQKRQAAQPAHIEERQLKSVITIYVYTDGTVTLTQS